MPSNFLVQTTTFQAVWRKIRQETLLLLIFREISPIMFFRILENRKSSIVLRALLNSILIREAKKWNIFSFLFRPMPKRGRSKNAALGLFQLCGETVCWFPILNWAKRPAWAKQYIQTRDKVKPSSISGGGGEGGSSPSLVIVQR